MLAVFGQNIDPNPKVEDSVSAPFLELVLENNIECLWLLRGK